MCTHIFAHTEAHKHTHTTNNTPHHTQFSRTQTHTHTHTRCTVVIYTHTPTFTFYLSALPPIARFHSQSSMNIISAAPEEVSFLSFLPWPSCTIQATHCVDHSSVSGRWHTVGPPQGVS
eukprot:GGOE01010927.1.p4 GENE.GGOE01010927.1~~GGOE01010927.1.p4  ORF type:complete len:119 (+),score=0.70 GGOE01010927.1:632-988(+)